MGHYEERLEQDLNHLMAKVQNMGGQVEKILEDAVHSLLTGNSTLAHNSVLSDHPINRAMREIDRLCHSFIALHLPSASHLRQISSVIRLVIELERIGDYAVIIAREGLQMSAPLAGLMATEVSSTASESRRMLNQALSAFYEGNADMAKAIMGMSEHLETTLNGVYASLMSGEHTASNQDMFAVFVVMTRLKRVADQAKNICEETVFAATGETKANRTYNVMFVDATSSSRGKMAVAIARRSFPNSGTYVCAGAGAATQFDLKVGDFLEGKGLDLDDIEPLAHKISLQDLAEQKVIVSLDGPVENHVDKVPFHAVALEWDVGAAPTEIDSEHRQQYIEKIYRTLSVQVRDLMVTLRGTGAD